MTLGNNLKEIRKGAGLSQEDFAEIFNVSRQTISNWENAKSYPDLETIIKISDSFNVSLDILLKGDLVMVKSFDKDVRNKKKYAKILLIIAIIMALAIGSFGVYSFMYFNAKSELEENFAKQLEDNNFYKNSDGYYSMDYEEGVVYSVLNQSMPPLMDFTLEFHVSNIYCDIELEDSYVEIVWEDYNRFYAESISKNDGKVIGSTSGFSENDLLDTKKLSDELGISEDKISEYIKKGNELHKDFYSKR